MKCKLNTSPQHLYSCVYNQKIHIGFTVYENLKMNIQCLLKSLHTSHAKKKKSYISLLRYISNSGW